MRIRFKIHSILVAILVLIAIPLSVYAVDGQIKIAQTPSTTFPIVIGAPGSYVLTSNIAVPYGALGINITANDVTLDLNGHILSGPGSGILILSNSNVQIQNGTVDGCGDGIRDVAGSGHRIINMRVVNNTGAGIYLGGTINSMVKNCTVGGQNGYPGIYTNVNAVITGNTVYNNGREGIITDRAIVSGNTVFNNTFDGISAPSSTVTGNNVHGNGRQGIFAPYSVITDNTIDNNGKNGIVGSGIITNNTVTNNNQSSDISAGGIRPTGNTLVKGNTLNYNQKNNIFIDTSRNVIENNIVTGSTYGINFFYGSNFYANNRASGNTTNYFNCCGNTDGGGNVSF
jgi:parallel beta-helix repeat protein